MHAVNVSLGASSEALLTTVAAALPGGSVNVLGRDFRYLFAAGGGLADAGLSPQALVGRTLREAFGDAAAFVEPYYERAFAGEQVTFDLPVFDRIYQVTAARMSDDAIVVLAQDVTAVRHGDKTAAALNAANQRRDLFFATMLHELRQPLAPLRFGIALLRRTSSMEQTRTLAAIERQVAHLERLLLDVTELARGGPGELDVHIDEVDAVGLLRETAHDSETLMRARNHALTVQIDVPEVTLQGDGARLRQVFSNLLINAAKYTEPGGQIVLSTQIDDGRIITSVRDNGRGIDPAVLPRIFDLFVQEDTRVTGMGIGLYVVRQIVERHGGTVKAHSAGKGTGSEFIVSLPLSST